MTILQPNDKMLNVHSDIRGAVYEEALRMQAAGKKVLKLNTGNPAVFGFSMPESIRLAIEGNLEKATAYCDLRGMPEAREAIFAYHREKGVAVHSEDDIFLGNGVSELVQMLSLVLFSRGDEVLLPTPNYSLWSNCCILAGATPVFYRCREEDNWAPDIESIRAAITDKTKAILVINPNNPTGAVYPKKVLEEIAAIARERDLVVLADEIYDRLVIDGEEHTSLAALCPDLVSVTFNGLSKSHIICGLRLGWCAVAGPERASAALRDGLVKLCAMRLCSNAVAQLAVPAALADRESTKSLLVPGGRLYEQREATCSVLEKIDGVHFVKNRASFYLFPGFDKEKFHIRDDKLFALDLLHAKNLLLIPGSGFDWPGNDHVRIVMLPEKEILKKAMEDLGDFLSDYRQE